MSIEKMHVIGSSVRRSPPGRFCPAGEIVIEEPAREDPGGFSVRNSHIRYCSGSYREIKEIPGIDGIVVLSDLHDIGVSPQRCKPGNELVEMDSIQF